MARATRKQPRVHACLVCRKLFSKPAYVAAHEVIHTGERAFVCAFDGCGKRYLRADHLKRHEAAHEAGRRPLQCRFPGCTISCSTADLLKRHERRHATLPFTCPWARCRRGFATSEELAAHRKLHEKTHECPQCQHCFKRLDRLKAHLVAVHAAQEALADPVVVPPATERHVAEPGDRDAADQAKPSARDGAGGDSHASPPAARARAARAATSATPVKTFPCTYPGCEKSYTQAKFLAVHVRAVHERARPFTCDNAGCGLAFAYKAVLKRHKTRCCALLPAAPQLQEAAREVASAAAASTVTAASARCVVATDTQPASASKVPSC